MERFEEMKKMQIEKLKKFEMEEIDKQIKQLNSELEWYETLLNYFDTFFIALRPPRNEKKYINESTIDIIFEEVDFKYNEQNTPIVIKCSLNDTIASLIEKYKEKKGNSFEDSTFMFENKELIPDLTVEKTNLYNNCKIKVISSSNDKG